MIYQCGSRDGWHQRKDSDGGDFRAEIYLNLDSANLIKRNLPDHTGFRYIIRDQSPSSSKCDCGRPQLLAGNAGKGIHNDTSDNNTIRRNTIGRGISGAALPNGSIAISIAQGFDNHFDDNSVIIQ